MRLSQLFGVEEGSENFMKRIYQPSRDEEKLVRRITKELENIAKKKFKMKEPSVKFNYTDGLHYERIHQNKDISVTITDSQKEIAMRIMVAYGQLLYYELKDNKKIYVAKLRDIAQNRNFKMENGEWLDTVFTSNNASDIYEKDEEDLFDRFEPLPDSRYIRNRKDYVDNSSKQNKNVDEEEERYLDWKRRQEYCRRFREEHGTDSIMVSDEY